jgi:1,4-dihydroxy-2-naphthoate octaprenyltransferase
METTNRVWLYTQVLFRMSRPLQLVSIVLVYVLGLLIAAATGRTINSTAAILGWLVILPISMSIHYANEYADHETDALTKRTPFSGGSGALPESGLSPHTALVAAWVSLLIGSGFALVGWRWGLLPSQALDVLVFGAFFGWMYSMPPLKLAWRGWGELTNASLGGVLLPVYAYTIQSGQVDLRIILASLPFGLLVLNNLLATQWADRGADAHVGKRSLAILWSTSKLRLTYTGVAAASYLMLLILRVTVYPEVVVWGSLLVLPVSVWGGITYTKQHSPFPAVAAMVLMLLVQMVGWYLVI